MLTVIIIRTNGAGIALGVWAIRADAVGVRIFVGSSITVVVQIVALFDWCRTAEPAGIEHTFVDAVITVVINAVTYLVSAIATAAIATVSA